VAHTVNLSSSRAAYPGGDRGSARHRRTDAGDIVTSPGEWRLVTRRSSADDRRCKMVHLGRRAQRVIAQINAVASELRHELLADIQRPNCDLHLRAGTDSGESRNERSSLSP